MSDDFWPAPALDRGWCSSGGVPAFPSIRQAMQPKAATRAICAFRTFGAMVVAGTPSGAAVRRCLARLRGIGDCLGCLKPDRFMRLSLPLLPQSVFLLLASLRGVPMLASERTQVGASSCVRLPSVLPPSLPSSVDVLRFADILSRHGFVSRLNKGHFKPSDPDRSEAIFR